MSNSDLVRDYLENFWNQGQVELAEKYIAEDLVQHNPNLPNGRAPLAEFVASIRTQMPDGRFNLARIAEDGDLVFAHSNFVPAPGQLGLAVVDIFRIENGLIAEHWDVSETVPETTKSGNPIV
jgi:predicted SnoaL-like aldol condensation-catalyzing enzyme